MVGTARKTKRPGEVGRNRKGGKATATTTSRAAARLMKLLTARPVWNDTYAVWLCPSCQVEVTEVDRGCNECTCCGQKIQG